MTRLSRILNSIPEKLWLVLAYCLLPIAKLFGWLEHEVGEKE